MFLTHGVDASGQLQTISEATSGLTQLTCPFCAETLIARKGSVKEHHFAHAAKTCAESQRTLRLTGIPLFDTTTGFDNTEMAVLEKVHKYKNCRESWITEKQSYAMNALILAGLIRRSESDHLLLTQLGADVMKYVHGIGRRYSITPDATMQEKLFVVRHKMLEHYDSMMGTRSADYFLLRLQMLMSQHLYVLNISLQQENVCYPLLKVGLTNRANIQDRVTEIRNDLRKHGEVLSITVLGVYERYGSLERLFHRKLHQHNFPLGTHREYFCAIGSAIPMAHLGLNSLGTRRLDGAHVHVTYRDHAHKVKAGQRRQKLIGNTHIGRPAKTDDALIRDHRDIVDAYERSLSLRRASAETGKSVNTVRKVYAALTDHSSY